MWVCTQKRKCTQLIDAHCTVFNVKTLKLTNKFRKSSNSTSTAYNVCMLYANVILGLHRRVVAICQKKKQLRPHRLSIMILWQILLGFNGIITFWCNAVRFITTTCMERCLPGFCKFLHLVSCELSINQLVVIHDIPYLMNFERSKRSTVSSVLRFSCKIVDLKFDLKVVYLGFYICLKYLWTFRITASFRSLKLLVGTQQTMHQQ